MTVGTRRAPYAEWRALAATCLVVPGAVGAHTWAGGDLPEGPVLVATAALVLGASLLVLRGAVRGAVLLPLLTLAQAGLHVCFTGASAHPAHLGHGEAGSAWTWQMLLAHGAVTALTALVWHLCSRAAVVVVSLLRLARLAVAPRLARRPAAAPSRALTHLGLLVTAPRRGPPVLAAR